MTPFDFAVEVRQMANFLSKLKADANWEGSPTLGLPRPAMPLTPAERFAKRSVSPQLKRMFGVETTGPGLDPSVDRRETTS